MRISSIIVLLATLGFSVPAHADWDMVSGVTTTAAATEMNQAKYQSPINPAALGGYSVAAPVSNFIPTGSGQSALNTGGAAGTSGNSTFRTNGIGVHPTQSMNRTHSQNSGLPSAGTMGMAPVFGYGSSGQTSPGGYVPPSVYIPGVGTVRIPQQVYIAPGVSVGLPAQGVSDVLNPGSAVNPIYDPYGMPYNNTSYPTSYYP